MEGETQERTKSEPYPDTRLYRTVSEEPVGRLGWEDMKLNGFLQRNVRSQGYMRLAYLTCHVCQAIEAKSLSRERGMAIYCA